MDVRESRHGRRIRHTERVIRNRLRFLRIMGPDEWYKMHLRDRHRLAKKHPWDCGKSRCFICHSEKLLKQQRTKDIIPECEYEEVP